MKPISECRTLQELFEDPSRWTQCKFAVDKTGESVSVYDDTAACFCLVGGIRRVYGSDGLAQSICRRVAGHVRATTGPELMDWNDHEDRTAKDIQDLCRELNI